jgi:hypothetical protein
MSPCEAEHASSLLASRSSLLASRLIQVPHLSRTQSLAEAP